MNVNFGRRVIRGVFAFSLAVMVPLGISGLAAPTARAATPSTIITLTFDDGTADQYSTAFPILNQYGMHGTFYVISGEIGVSSGYMTLPQLRELYAAGNEIASHSVLHPFLTQVSTDEATREICDSRNTLLKWGFPATDFGFPHSDYNAALEGIVRNCGYNSARVHSKIQSPYGCAGCPLAETVPPQNPYEVRSPTSILDTWTLADIESEVTQAENAGGWMLLTFHHICDSGCGSYSVTPATFSDFLAWLQTQNVSVETVSQVIGGPVNPAVSAPQAPPAPPGVNGVANPSLETADPYQAGVPACWTPNTTGTNSATFAETSDAHSGSVAETVTISSYTSGAARLIIGRDLGQCAPSVVAGDPYVASAWYKSTAPTRFVLWYRDADGGWHWWTQSPQITAAAAWTHATWTTPAVPSGATALRFGLDLTAVGSITSDDYGLSDASAPPPSDTTPPATAIACDGAPCASGWYRASPVTVTLSATDTGGSGVAQTRYTTDGTDPSTSSTAVAYTGPFPVSQTTTVRYYSIDVAGNSEQPGSALIQIDAAAPSIGITAPVSGSVYKRGAKVTVTAISSDNGTGSGSASGVSQVVFRLDGVVILATRTALPYQFTWNTRSASAGTHTLTAVSTDRAGNSAVSAPVTITIRK